jgi:serine/threonine-protein kinase
MSLPPGTRLGPYEILAPIGAGGMGEVYRAHDAKLHRDVALKVLPEAFATDPDRLARFRREAQVLASLNHPNIGHLYGFEDSGATRALVMELVEGPTLADRIAQGPLPLADVLPIARQIVDALEAAHEQGIVHRDLKPANIKVRADDTVKVLDFGLAKALGPAAASEAAAALAYSPTITSPALTERGVILGTAAYMSPEQAAGKAADKRSDLWGFGVVLLEMLTGRRVFAGPDVAHVVAAVLKSEPDWTTLPAETPTSVRRLLRRCLEKDRRHRLADASDARLELDEVGSAADREGVLAATPGATAAVPAWRRALPWAVAGMFGVALIASLLVWAPWRSTPVPTPRKLLALVGADASLPTTLGASAVLSPDGTTLAFVAQQAGQTRLFVRKLDQLRAIALAGTEDAANPFFSPEGQWIAFFAGGRLKKVSVTGGAAVTLCDAPSGRGGTWADDDTIIFSPTSASNNKLLRVSAAGGNPAVFGTLSAGATTQRWPQALPGGKGVLYTEHSSGIGFDLANLVVAPLTGGAPTVVLRGGYSGRYIPTGLASPTRSERAGGHLIYMKQGTVFAVPFDLDHLETIGPAMPASPRVPTRVACSWPSRQRARWCMCQARPRKWRIRSTG